MKITFRAKLDSESTYLLKAEDIGQALQDIPQFDELKLYFATRQAWPLAVYSPKSKVVKWTGDFTGLVPDHYLLKASYSVRLNQWDINVFSVPKKHSDILKQIILNTGLPLIQLWFVKERSETWLDGDFKISIGVSQDLAIYAVEETFKSMQIHKEVGCLNPIVSI